MRFFSVSYLAVVTASVVMILTILNVDVRGESTVSVIAQSESTYVSSIAAPVSEPSATHPLAAAPECPPAGHAKVDSSGVPCPPEHPSGDDGHDKCPLVFIGLHGLNEDSGSLVVRDTWDRFDRLVKTKGIPVDDAVFLTYKKLTFPEFYQSLDQKDFGQIGEGIAELNKAAINAANKCHPARLVLVGYSEGAWILDSWIHNAEPAQVKQIAGIVVYGDPQWGGSSGQGAARRLGMGLDPYIPPTPLGARFTTFCHPTDPVCGEGYGINLSKQIDDGKALQVLCVSHCEYKPDFTKQGAEALAAPVAK